jgi:phosphocarrier protein FPr
MTSVNSLEQEARLKVNLVLISHSGTLVEGLREMVGQVAGGEVRVEIAGGTEDGRLGTSATKIVSALRIALAPGFGGVPDVLVLLDLGSAALSLEVALEDLTERDRARVRISEAPLVEGAILAAVQASVGASIEEVAAAAAGASTMAKMPRS